VATKDFHMAAMNEGNNCGYGILDYIEDRCAPKTQKKQTRLLPE
jgi:hypothetical protein